MISLKLYAYEICVPFSQIAMHFNEKKILKKYFYSHQYLYKISVWYSSWLYKIKKLNVLL